MAVRDIIQAAGGSAATTAAVYVEDVFSTYLYTGNATTQTITNGIDLATKGGLVWTKARNSSNSFNALYDTARGANKALSSNSTFASQNGSSSDGLTAFNTNGFSLGGLWVDENIYNQPTVSWTFRKQAKFFTICTWTGDGVAGRQISHDLGCAPGMIILKATSAAYNWRVYHKSIGATQHLALNTTDAANTLTGSWNDTSPTSTVFTIGNSPGVNESGQTYVAYLFADSNSGGFGAAGTDSVVACGSYTGNGSASGPTVTLGWEPQFVLVKNSSAANDWQIVDTMRGMSYATGLALAPNLAKTETWEGTNPFIVPTSTGFKVITSSNASFNTSSNTYIYLAIRRGPMKTPTDATKVFQPVLQNGGGTVTTNFPVDMVNFKQKDYTGGIRFVPRLTNGELYSSDTSAENAASYWKFDNSKAFVDAGLSTSIPVIYWNFRRAPGFMDCVCYTGTGSATTVAHNLGVAPELMLFKDRQPGGNSWVVYHTALGNTGRVILNSASANNPSTLTFNSTSPTASVFTVGSSFGTNYSGSTYVAYLFASAAGVSKVGSYTGNGSSQTINCGFASGARFVLIKRTDSTGDWYVWDTARGIVSANDPHLSLNTTAAEVTTDDTIDPDSSGFIVNQVSGIDCNVSGASYIFLSVA